VTDPNIHRPEWDYDLTDPPFRARSMRLGPRAGASEIGVSLFEIDPDGAVAPYHVHHGNEELLLVLSGTPQLRTPDGVRTLEAGAMVAFPRGPAGAHRIANHSAEPVRLLIFSTMHFPEVAEHLDTGAWLALTGPLDGKVFPAGADAPVIEAVVQAMRAATEHEPPHD
jgi:uncharacterized cupin superfamily protein